MGSLLPMFPLHSGERQMSSFAFMDVAVPVRLLVAGPTPVPVGSMVFFLMRLVVSRRSSTVSVVLREPRAVLLR